MHLVKDKKEILIALLIAFIIILGSFNYHLYSTCFHGSLIKKYSDNPTYLEIDKDVTRYITGFSSELNVDFNEDEKSHMVDVKRLIMFEQLLFIFLMVWLFILIKKRKINYLHLKKVALIVILTAIFSLIASLFFNRFFELFHLIFFPMGNWQFNAGSLMIQTYQQAFFQGFFVRMVIVLFIVSFSMVIIIITL
ncbi:MAG: DUF1461 domain-containing protein [Nanoarchaeota archaeon]|nr:DUF1461 domain-containing protein [Nanoarchaeota archaeon]